MSQKTIQFNQYEKKDSIGCPDTQYVYQNHHGYAMGTITSPGFDDGAYPNNFKDSFLNFLSKKIKIYFILILMVILIILVHETFKV